MHEPRFYRNSMGLDRFRSFVVTYKDSDLWIGIDHAHFEPQLPHFVLTKLIEIRSKLEKYLLIHPEFASSLTPVDPLIGAPITAMNMAFAAKKAGTGPMAAVAGEFAQQIGTLIIEKFSPNELVIENGGDIFLKLMSKLALVVYAGKSLLSNKIAVEIDPLQTPLGICTSAGTVGPSKSFGKADAVMVAATNTALADAFATSIGNKVKCANDITTALTYCESNPDLKQILIICENQLGVNGIFQIKPVVI